MRYLRRKMEGKPRQICLLNTKEGGEHRPIRSGEREEAKTEQEQRLPNKAEGEEGCRAIALENTRGRSEAEA